MSIFYRTLYDFEAEDEGELSVKAGSIVREYPSGLEYPNEGWTFVQAADFSVGFVPANYLKQQEGRIRPLDNPNPATPVSASTAMGLHSPDDEAEPDSGGRKVVNNVSLQVDYKAGMITSSIVSTPSSSVASSVMNSTTNTNKMTAKVQSILNQKSTNVKKQTLNKFIGETSKAAGFVPAAEKEDLTELKKVAEDHFQKIISTQTDNFEMLTDMVLSLSDQLNAYGEMSSGFLNKLSELDEYVESEKRKLVLKVNSSVMPILS